MAEMLKSQIEPDAGGCGHDELFALQVRGDSMAPEFEDGCVIVLDPSGVARHESYVVVEINGELVFRQYLEMEEGTFARTTEVPGVMDPVSLDQVRGVVVQKSGVKGRRRKDAKKYY
jgi:hypothetical protein